MPLRKGDTAGGGMAASDWIEIYRSYSTDELNEEIRKLKEDLEGGFTSQQSGGTGHTRDTADLAARLKAASRVKEQRAGRGPVRRGTVDFSRNQRGDF